MEKSAKSDFVRWGYQTKVAHKVCTFSPKSGGLDPNHLANTADTSDQ